MLRNTAGQKFTVVAFNETGRITGDAANITCTIAIDGGTRVALQDLNPTEISGSGRYEFDLSKAETNGHELSFAPVSSTPGVQILGTPADVIYTVVPVSNGQDDLSENLRDLVVGDDYVSDNGRPIEFNVTKPTGGDGSTVAELIFTGGTGGDDTLSVTGAVTDMGDELHLEFDVTGAQLIALGTGTYQYAVKLRDTSDNVTTPRSGNCRLVNRQLMS